MDLGVPFEFTREVRKNLFKLKPIRRDGLLLSIHHSKANTKIRFVHCCFHETGHIIASADNDGHLYLVDFFSCKCWGLPKLDSCTFIKFSPFNQHEILSGGGNGDIRIIDFDSGQETGKLQGHKHPISQVSFAQKIYCLSASHYEAVIWDLQTNTKVQVLSLECSNILKHVVFMPVSNNVLVCFQDDLIQIWNSCTFESVKQFLPTNWNNYCVKSIAFSRNGQIMIVAGYLPVLAIFLLNKWKMAKLITLPEYVHSVKSVEFVTQPFDGGANKILAILAGHGIIYFYDIEQNVIISELMLKCEIIKFECCPNGSYIACTVCSGEVELYNLSQYVLPPDNVRVEKVRRKKLITYKKCPEGIEFIRSQIDSVLDIDKLRSILKEYGEYPKAHRTKIWEKLLQLPNNIKQYNNIINHVTLITFKDLYVKYPLESKLSIQNLRKLLNNIVTWCPFFAHVEYLPVFVFPFVKVFHNKPVRCFEAVCTIILNWCQHWFEYFPLPPVNTLAMVENILMEHDPELLQHFLSNDITANLYAWSLFESALSEVLTSSEWLMLWDHVLTNEPSFLICAVASYNIVHRNMLLSMKKMQEFEFFYHNQNPNDVKKFIKKTYYVLKNTSKNIHARQYLEVFKPIQPGNYPLFVEYPKTIIDFQTQHIKGLDNELLDIEMYEEDLIAKAGLRWREFDELKIQKEEERRLKEMEKACLKKIEKNRKKLSLKQEELQCLKKILCEEEYKILGDARENLSCECGKNQSSIHEYLMDNIQGHCENKLNLSKEQAKYVRQYGELLKYKYRIKELKNRDMLPEDVEKKILQKYQNKLDAEIDRVKNSLCSTENLKKLNIATSLIVMETLIGNIEKQLHHESASKSFGDTYGSTKIKTLEEETEGLESEVSKLLSLISKDHNKTNTEVLYHTYRDLDSSDGQEQKSSCKVLYSKAVRFSTPTDSMNCE